MKNFPINAFFVIIFARIKIKSFKKVNIYVFDLNNWFYRRNRLYELLILSQTLILNII